MERRACRVFTAPSLFQSVKMTDVKTVRKALTEYGLLNKQTLLRAAQESQTASIWQWNLLYPICFPFLRAPCLSEMIMVLCCWVNVQPSVVPTPRLCITKSWSFRKALLLSSWSLLSGRRSVK